MITDWGGVLTGPLLDTVRAWIAADDIDFDSYLAVMRPWVTGAYESTAAVNPIHALELGQCTDAEFEQKVLQSDTPVLVDFWAAWCGPCRALAPVVDAVAEQYDGKLKVMKMDVDKNNMTPGRYGIRGIPALLVFKGGKVAEQIVGFVPKDTIDETLKRVLV